jgi:2-oxo-3-hexenedioate decarboxylase
MAASVEILRELAETSLKGEREVHSIDQFYTTYSDMTQHDGYIGQKIRLDMMLAEGYKLVGAKMGGTSLAKARQVQTTLTAGAVIKAVRPSSGMLMDYMQLNEGEDLQIAQLIHPRIEAELAFVIGKELYGNHITVPDVMNATSYVVPAFELIDSRFHGFKMGGAADALIDNISSARFKLGKVRKDPFEVDMIGMGVRTKINGEFTGFGASGAVLGHPARAVASLVKTLYEEMNMGIPAGFIVLTGAITASQPIFRGDKVVSDYEGMGSIELNVI